MALSDFCKAPEIKVIDTNNYLGTANDKIRVRAMGNFRVISVRVSVYDAADILIESGLATLSKNGVDWYFKLTVTSANIIGHKIKAEVTDMPGNMTSETVMI